ncbi:unnamed protein product [Brugia timori]|uniref:Secreted protein n=1 Tax=Brugia timori TaxID=42155 RepID=A0A0R3QJ19_9BILA|nr:unnamed protein product [Brugia timori]
MMNEESSFFFLSILVVEVFSFFEDSLTRFFTPTNQRRSRVAQSSFSLETFEPGASSSRAASYKSIESKKHHFSAISIDTKQSDLQSPISLQPSISSSLKSGQSTPSPHRRTDALFDALSPYFSAASEKRRTFSKVHFIIFLRLVSNCFCLFISLLIVSFFHTCSRSNSVTFFLGS